MGDDDDAKIQIRCVHFCPSVVVFLRSSDSPSCVGRDVAGLGWVGAVRCVALAVRLCVRAFNLALCVSVLVWGGCSDAAEGAVELIRTVMAETKCCTHVAHDSANQRPWP